ncbi:hypothetical protein [Hymenobacter sp. BT491]|uniref:hypothetical protein n=1 Tax=Hymenobacter sp. BT491 TaxID=2766779 RepID=UPI001653C71A|nr:hypothetical protein [Hymenobacter sp. BT491]MBC6989877.1 hypothetical protein [Hymenobacter sp. BT491]
MFPYLNVAPSNTRPWGAQTTRATSAPRGARLFWALGVLGVLLLLGACQGNSETARRPGCRPVATSSLFSAAQAAALAQALTRSLAQQQHHPTNAVAAKSAASYVFRNMLQQDTARLQRQWSAFFRYLRTTAPFGPQAPGCAVYLLDYELIGEDDFTTYVLFAHPQGGTYYAFAQLDSRNWRLTRQGKFANPDLVRALDTVLTRANRCPVTTDYAKQSMLLARFTPPEHWMALAAADRCDQTQQTLNALLDTVYAGR